MTMDPAVGAVPPLAPTAFVRVKAFSKTIQRASEALARTAGRERMVPVVLLPAMLNSSAKTYDSACDQLGR